MNKRILFFLVPCVVVVLAVHLVSAGQKGGLSMDFQIKSKAFENKTSIPSKYTGDGPDVSPPLAWTNAPEATKVFVLICDDPDAPMGTWVHWVLYDIPADIHALDEAIPKDEQVLGSAKQGRNDFRRIGYDGPAPPRGKPHRYLFNLYATDKETGLKPGATKDQALKAIKGHVLAQTELTGTYQR